MRGVSTFAGLALMTAALAGPTPAGAGEEATAPGSRVEALRRDLRSADAATVAWAAYAAGGEGLRALETDLLRCLDDPPRPTVVGHLLDALIRLNTTVPMKVLARYEERMRWRVLILAVRNGKEAYPLLRRTLGRSVGSRGIHAAGVAAGNVLVAAKDPAAAALFVGHLEPDVSVTVVDHDRPTGGGWSFAVCHGDGMYEATEGFPPTVWYELDFDRSESLESHLLVRGPTKDVWYTRWEDGRTRFIIGDLSDRGDVTEIGLGWIAALLGTNVEELPLQRRYFLRDHRWTGANAYVAFLEAQRQAVRRDADAVLGRLHEAGLLSAAERRAVDIRPRFRVNDERDHRDEPLPALADATVQARSP